MTVGRSRVAAFENKLRGKIANFYDKSSTVWEEIWGEHMHHGYYPGGKWRKDHKQAQIDMIDEVLKWAGVKAPHTVIDVGCGVGGSLRHIARKYRSVSTGKGITLSPFQRDRAEALTKEADKSDKAKGRKRLGRKLGFEVADAMDMPYRANAFDLAWSMESGEHIPDRPRFIKEIKRVVRPGGRVIVVTWCQRNLEPDETELKPREKRLLNWVSRLYHLPEWWSIDDYTKCAKDLGLRDIRTADWSKEISPFWPAVVQSALTPKGLIGLFRAGPETMAGALTMGLMITGYRQKVIRFNLMTARKATRTERLLSSLGLGGKA
ncbi:unnamed protein product [Vitrella brassicaformis CCMP3155]|uniref:Methyltransferase type 11 domain-containing protein n=2 Tax=Vitrella brassicaformis TaxID=1169539 RepID=A0A0G4EGY1_VITBC|nr:unnamed protein product [Vitrella brassicaformis CCMP3155]|eukprot:CEL94765.1 unnamed protein product [Vitrella brassicaformis CCMP3155]